MAIMFLWSYHPGISCTAKLNVSPQKMTQVGLEPRFPSSEVWCHIHKASFFRSNHSQRVLCKLNWQSFQKIASSMLILMAILALWINLPGISCIANLNETPQRRPRWDLNPQSPAPEADALSIRPLGPSSNQPRSTQVFIDSLMQATLTSFRKLPFLC